VRIIVASAIVPFSDDRARRIARELAAKLRWAGNEVDVLELPFWSDWPTVPDQMLALRLTDVSGADLLIAVGTPAHLLRHSHKVLWFISHDRDANDLWGTPHGDIPDTPEGRQVRDSIMRVDATALAEARRVFTVSRVMSDRLGRCNAVDPEVLYPPLWEAERFRPGPYGDYLVYVSRITSRNRQRLAISALRHVSSSVRLVVAGPPAHPSDLAQLRAITGEPAISGRLELIPRWIIEEEKIELVAGALGVLYMPVDEDSSGYPPLEAFHAGKPVITCSDCAGMLELIEDGRNGFIVEPRATAVAATMDRLCRQDGLAERVGLAGAARLSELEISWDRVVSALTS
jgi:glycosyltransferase involved in cell wall biosynthesis